MISDFKKRLHRELDGLVEELTVRIPSRLGREQSPQDYHRVVELQRHIQDRIQLLHGTLAALAGLEPGMLPPAGAGFGSRVHVRDLDSGAELHYTLMAGGAIDLDAGEISLASPVGRALLGRAPGDEVQVATPLGRRRLRVVEVTTLGDTLAAPRPREMDVATA